MWVGFPCKVAVKNAAIAPCANMWYDGSIELLLALLQRTRHAGNESVSDLQ